VDYRFLLARRYLTGARRVSFITLITGISIAGMSLGVASLIVVLSVMNGFYDLVRDLLVSLDPHVRIVRTDGHNIAEEEIAALVPVLLSYPQVEEVYPYVEGKALLIAEGRGEINRVVIVRGIDPQREPAVAQRGMIMGKNLAARLGITTQDGQVALLSAPGIEQILTRLFGAPPLIRFDVRGLFQLEQTYDNTHVFVGLTEAQQLFRITEGVTGMELRLRHIQEAADVKDALEQTLDTDRLRVRTWYDLQRSLYDVMRLEKWGASAILLLISIVAAFNLIGSLTMMVMEKRRDMGVLQAMGASRRHIRHIFLLEGALIGCLGTGLGFLIGLTLVWLQETFGLVPLMGADSFLVDTYPVSVQPVDLLLIGVVSVGLCLLASVYPAARAARIEPARAVQVDR